MARTSSRSHSGTGVTALAWSLAFRWRRSSTSCRTLSCFPRWSEKTASAKNLSPWEQGVMYKRAIDEGLFPSLRKLAS